MSQRVIFLGDGRYEGLIWRHGARWRTRLVDVKSRRNVEAVTEHATVEQAQAWLVGVAALAIEADVGEA